ncbi:MAG: damage-inducible protein CinA [Alphaproteobacteria bacterium HGW-Alphaproteobacteria-1]|jgi:nicotinamide-nucleotide amidase|nr:MAG: damage-inducible protein CinA [Alphaproteobacteria bacterium HGW-Alphaproteobacteria-1]
MSIASQIIDIAKQRRLMIAAAESCTGGMVAVALTDVAGSSAVVERGFVTYSDAAKVEMLGVAPATLAAHGAVSEEVAREMAQGALNHSGAQLAISITGIAGPGGSEHKPEGRVCFGLAMAGHATHTETQEFGAPGRAEVRRLSRDHALRLLRDALTS